MGRKVIVATCSLNQWAMDFEQNQKHILQSEWDLLINWFIYWLIGLGN